MSEYFGMNFLYYPMNPKSLLTSVRSVGGGICCKLSNFSGIGSKP